MIDETNKDPMALFHQVIREMKKQGSPVEEWAPLIWME
jgi:hypothetical protein